MNQYSSYTYYTYTSANSSVGSYFPISDRISWMTIVTANNVHMYKTFAVSVEIELEKYIYENITKKSLIRYGKAYTYDKIENEIDKIIQAIIIDQEYNGFIVKELDYDAVVKEIRDNINRNILYDMVDVIYKS